MIGERSFPRSSAFQTMFDEKRAWNEFAQEACEYWYPVRASYTSANPVGPDFASNVMDSHTVNVREELGNAIGSMLRQDQWFDIGTGDEERDTDIENARSLRHATKLFRAVLKDRRSGFEAATKEGDHDWVSVGSPCSRLPKPPTAISSWSRHGTPARAHGLWVRTAVRRRFTARSACARVKSSAMPALVAGRTSTPRLRLRP